MTMTCGLTVLVPVVIAFVAKAVLVRVPLGGVLNAPAVVTGVPVDILIAVLLVHVGNKPTVVLRQTNSIDFSRVSQEPPQTDAVG